MKEIIKTRKLASPVAPYSMAVKNGNTVYISGQIALDAETNRVIHGTASEQAKMAMDNIKTILEANGMTMEDILKCDVYVTSMANMPEINKAYAQYFMEPPARVVVEVTGLYDGVLVEIDAIAAI